MADTSSLEIGRQPVPVAKGDDVTSPHARHLTTGDMARLSKSTLRTVRFYEEEGILRPMARTEGGHRLFERDELDRLLLVIDMRAAGLSLGEIKALLEMKAHAASGGDAAKQATRELAQRVRELDAKLAALTRLREDLLKTSAVVAGCQPCGGHELFPEGCDRCAIIVSQAILPRGLKVLWSVGAKRPEAIDDEVDDAAIAHDADAGEPR